MNPKKHLERAALIVPNPYTTRVEQKTDFILGNTSQYRMEHDPVITVSNHHLTYNTQ
jgi:hypothetical protein